MNGKNIALAGLVGGAVLFVLLFGTSLLMNTFVSYGISGFGGMRAMNDPVMLLFFFYPFVVAFAQAFVFDLAKDSLKGTRVRKGLMFSAMMFIIMTIPGLFVMYTSMTWPVGFYIATLFWEVPGFLVTGALYTKIWNI